MSLSLCCCVQLRDLPADVSEKDVIEAFEKEDPELQIIKVRSSASSVLLSRVLSSVSSMD